MGDMSFHRTKKEKPKNAAPMPLHYRNWMTKRARKVEDSLDKDFGKRIRKKWDPFHGTITP